MKAKQSIRNFTDLPTTPGRHDLILRVGAGKTRRDLNVWYQRGAEAGPCMAITSMVHGDEFEGFAATQMIWKKLRGRRVQGSVLIIPICNPWAAEAATRTTPSPMDGGNLARSFPGSLRGKPTQRLARQLWDLIRGADALLDFHSGGTGYDYADLAGFYRKEDSPLAACFPIKYIWKIPVNRGVLSHEFSRLGKPAIGCEYSGEARLNPKGARAYASGALAMMTRLGLLQGSRSPRRSMTRLNVTRIQFAQESGWFFTHLKIGDRIRKGDSIGTWTTSQLRSREMRSQFAGTVIGLRTLPRVPSGEGLLIVSR